VVFACLFAPGLWVLWLTLSDQLGARPTMEAIHQLGLWAMRFLFLSFAITPLRHALRWAQLIQIRRMVGVAASVYAVAHFSGYIVDQAFDLEKVLSEIVMRFYLTIGLVALIGLVVLGVTSTDKMIRRIGGMRWRRLHQTGYVMGVLVSIHYFMQSKLGVDEATVMGGLYFWMMAYRVAMQRQKQATSPLWLFGTLSATATLVTFIAETGYFWLWLHVDPWRVLAASMSLVIGIRPGWYVLAVTLAVTVLAAVRAAPPRKQGTPARAY
jgi:sulfoxide reductase heme-binding subunit YedZ